uniref:Ground-like domain-containing protein n=1 Tax=Panagrellus redivivus TaxID=6233 RepID=A0A7E4UW48_PANRE
MVAMYGFIAIALVLSGSTEALFFGSSGCCQEQPSCGCAPPPACPAPQVQYIQAPAPPPPPPAYVQPIAAPCRPRYIVVRPLPEPVNVGYVPIQEGYAQAGQQLPQAPIEVQQPQQYNQGAVEVPQQIAQPIENAEQAGYKALASKTVTLDARCNSIELRKVLENEITPGSANESKRRVHTVANMQFTTPNKSIDVICAASKFSYRIATDLFCEHTKEDITCFAFEQNL